MDKYRGRNVVALPMPLIEQFELLEARGGKYIPPILKRKRLSGLKPKALIVPKEKLAIENPIDVH